MDPLNQIFKHQTEAIARRAKAFSDHKKRVPKKPKAQTLRLFKGTINIPNNIFEILLTDPDLSLRELKILMLIVRLTIGMNRYYCILRNRDFEASGVRETHSQKIIESLIEKKWLTKHKGQGGETTYSFHRERHTNQNRDPLLSHLICTQMHKIGIFNKK